MQVDHERLEALLGKMVGDMGAAVNGALVIVGEKLGLYRALAAEGGATPTELAAATGTAERYVREWLSAQAAMGYAAYDPASGRFSLSPEQAAIFADPESPFLMTGGFQSIAAVYNDAFKLADHFRTGEGMGWGDHCNCLFCGVEKFFRPNYKGHLVPDWLPSLDGVVDKLRQGGKVADVGCGHGASTLLMAEAFPQAEFVGFDFHDASIETARQRAAESGLSNVRFEVATAKSYSDSGFDLVTFFDCLHDMGDPVGAMRHTRQALKPDGAVMLVEPMAGNELSDNLNPVGAVYYGFSTSVCVPTSLAQETGAALGAQAGEARLREVAETAGFSSFRRANETPFNMILEARP
jgi:ubiquinone/menaquinone biosynthesis C-methylase UbiE